MTIFLTSSPFVENAPGPILSNANGFIDRIREALPPFPRFLYVCSSPDRRDLNCQFASDVIVAFAGAGIYFSSFEILDGESAENAGELVATSDFLVFSGGHVPTQNQFFQDIGLRELLQDWDGVAMGISAGTMNAAETVYVQPEEEGESSPDFPRWAPGLDLTDVNVLPHYQKVKDDILDGLRLFEDITYPDSEGNCFFALVDGSYICQDENSQILYGEAYTLRDGELEQVCEEGEMRNLAEEI